METKETKQEIVSILKERKEELKEKYKVKRIGVFGSFSRGEERKDSDIDILVEFTEPVGFFLFIDLENYLSNLLGKKVDLATKNALKPIVKEKIITDTIYAE